MKQDNHDGSKAFQTQGVTVNNINAESGSTININNNSESNKYPAKKSEKIEQAVIESVKTDSDDVLKTIESEWKLKYSNTLEEINKSYSHEASLVIIKNLIENTDNKTKKYSDLIEDLDSEASINLVIRGEPGAGKTIAAKSTYKYIDHLYNKNKDNTIFPLYFSFLWDIEKILCKSHEFPDNVLINKVIKRLEEYIYTLIHNQNKIILIFDGFDIHNPFSHEALKLLKNLQSNTKFKTCHLILFERIYPPLDKYDASINHKNICGIEEIIINRKFYIKLAPRSVEPMAESLASIFNLSCNDKKIVESYKILNEEFFDFPCLRLLHRYIANQTEFHDHAYSSFLEDIASQYFNKNPIISKGRSLNPQDSKDYASEFAFSFLFEHGKKHHELNIAKSDSLLAKRLSTQSNEMLFYLASRYLVNSLFSSELFTDEKKSRFNKIYPYYFNKYIGGAINSLGKTEDEIFEIIKNNFQDCDLELRSFFAYMSGRFTDKRIRGKSEGFIKNEIKELQNKHDQSISYRVLYRSLYISLMYLGGNANEYIKQILNNATDNSINRGFHLVYYGDKNFFRQKDMNIEDSENESFNNTYIALKRNICVSSDNISKGKNDVSIITLYSLALNRYLNGSLSDTINENNELGEIAKNHIINNNKVSHDAKLFVKHCLEYLNSSHKPRLQRAFWLLQLKSLPRQGWITNGRNVKNSESIASHMYSAILLAYQYLPDRLSAEFKKDTRYKNYSKQEIIELLIVHDLSECIYGDVAKPCKTEVDSQYEIEVIGQLGLVDLVQSKESSDYIPKYNESIKTKWYSFLENKASNINSAIANDIDKLECLLQLHCYYDSDKQSMSKDNFEKFKTDLNNNINTKLIKDLISEYFKELM